MREGVRLIPNSDDLTLCFLSNNSLFESPKSYVFVSNSWTSLCITQLDTVIYILTSLSLSLSLSLCLSSVSSVIAGGWCRRWKPSDYIVSLGCCLGFMAYQPL